MEKTKPKSRGIGPETEPALLTAWRYGTDDMIEIWGAERTFDLSLRAQAAAIETMSSLHPDVIPPEDAVELIGMADLEHIDPDRIRKLEEQGRHDVIAINTAWEEEVSDQAAAHINKGRTSADTTETAKALQLKRSLVVIADSLENLRDITLERSVEWIDIPHMDVSHLYDALPTFAGRPFSFYAEMLQSGLDFLAFVYANSIVGKWADATGNHHSCTALGVDGMELQKEYCNKLGIGHMTAPAQIPGREFITDIVYSLARSAETMRNLAHYIRWGRSDDVGIFRVPGGKKGSSAMPHKDVKGGNPTVEEQTESFSNYMRGVLATSLSSCTFDYARDLSGSASDRIILEDSFKFGDHVIRNLAILVYELELIEDRTRKRFDRSYGVVTAQQVMTYLTDPRRTSKPMRRKDAHKLTAQLATMAYDGKRSFTGVCLECDEVTTRLDSDEIRAITDPFKYMGQSKEIIRDVYNRLHGKKTLQV